MSEEEYNHSIDVQKEALDQQLKDFTDEKENEKERLNEYVKNTELVLQDTNEIVRQNTETISREIENIAREHGIQVSSIITDSWKTGENAISNYNTALTNESSNFALALGGMINSVNQLQAEADATANTIARMYNQNSDYLITELGKSYESANNLKTVTDGLQQGFVDALERGYNVSQLVNNLNEVTNAANSANSAVNSIGGTYTTTGGTTWDPKKWNGEDYSKEDGLSGYKYKFVGGGGGNVCYVYKDDKKVDALPYDVMVKKYGKITARATGGLITKDPTNPLNAIARAVGEDTLVAAKDGEYVLTPAQTAGFLDLVSNLDILGSVMKNVTPPVGVSQNNMQSSPVINYEALIKVEGDVNNSNIKQIQDIANNVVSKQFDRLNMDLRKHGVR